MIDEGNFDIPAPVEVLLRAFPAYYDRDILPSSGGSLDQDEGIMDGLYLIMNLIQWWMIEEQKPDHGDLPDIDEV